MSLAPERRERPEALAEPVRKVGPGWVALYVLAGVGVFIPMQVPTTFPDARADRPDRPGGKGRQ
ncbi:hypothetical protein [Streptomyces coffeae]|uniref:hypothetical protein n=1 Tax=Streptomyces coffeae TaxID=621382 RepID=UPI001F1E1A17|nr:hypothetical protein [Streptomyces coffeae]